MATESTKDAVVKTDGVPPSQQANLNVATTPNSTVITNTGDTAGLNTEVTGNVVATGGTYQSATFTFGTSSTGSPPSLTVTNTKISGTTIVGGSTADSYTQGGSPSTAKSRATTKSKDTMGDFGDGADSVTFLRKSLDKGSNYDLGGGADSITFGKKSTSKKARVHLGDGDNTGDVVSIHKKAEVKKLKITEFGKDDVLKIGGKTYDYDQLQDEGGKIGKNISIKFD